MPDIAVVIPTAGPARKMRSIGPRALLQMGDGRTLLRRQIDVIRSVLPKA